jgi:OOP family OmpA-OmpF porin
MSKSVGFLLAILVGCIGAFGQAEPVQPPTLGIQFFFDDFKTAWYIRNSSLRQVLRNGQFGRLKDMSPGLAINYIYGLSKHYDFSTTLTGAFLDYIKRDGSSFGSDHLLLEGDVSIRGKMFTNKYWVSPFLQIGTGISKYKGYWGAFIPAGMGVQFNLFQEAYLLINAQYRIAVTETVSNHYFFSLGLAGSIGRRRAANNSVLPL